MEIWTRNLNQLATYWPPGVSDGYGRQTASAPTLIYCRWQDQNNLVRNGQGEEVTSSAVAYVSQELEEGGFLALGDFTSSVANPRNVSGAKSIIATGASPSLNADIQILKVWM